MTAQPHDFSVIIPTYNRPASLARCLRALAEQDCPSTLFETIVVDDGGHTPLEPVISQFHTSLKVKCLRIPNGGPAAARNRGAAMAGGRFIAFTDDDCAPSAGWLRSLKFSIDSSPEALVGGGVRNLLTGNPFSSASQLILDFVYDYYHRQAQPGHRAIRFFSSNNMAVSARLFRELGGFNPGFRTSEDRDFCDRWAAAGHSFTYAGDAFVYHSNDLNFWSFWRQHLGYGRGARRFYNAHRFRCDGETTIDQGFYFSLIFELPSLIWRQKRHRIVLPLLMAVWQAANLAGFLQESFSSRPGLGDRAT